MLLCSVRGVDIRCVASLIDSQLTFVKPMEAFHIKPYKLFPEVRLQFSTTEREIRGCRCHFIFTLN